MTLFGSKRDRGLRDRDRLILTHLGLRLSAAARDQERRDEHEREDRHPPERAVSKRSRCVV